MARRISGGLAGQPSVGAINVAPTAVVTAATNQDITIQPTGTGRVVLAGDVQINATGDLRFADADNSNYVGFQAPSAVTTNRLWTLPATDGTSDQVLTTNGSQTLSWSSKTIALSDQTTSTSTHYVTITPSTSGAVSGVNVSSSRITFQPSTGNLTVSGRMFSAGALVPTAFTVAYAESSVTRNAAGFITSYTANGIAYSLITYGTETGVGTSYGATYQRPISWRETDTTTGAIRNITVTYNATTGRVQTLTVA